MVNVLPGFLTKGRIESVGSQPYGASKQFKHGRAFVLGSLAGKALIWPAAIFAGVLFIPFLFSRGGWLPMAALILGGLFFIALFLRLFVPGVLASIINVPGFTLLSARPFVLGMLMSGILAVVLRSTGYLPFVQPPMQTASKSNDDIQSGPIISEEIRPTNFEDTKHYVTWKDDEFIEVETAFCVGGMSVFLPKDKAISVHPLIQTAWFMTLMVIAQTRLALVAHQV